MRESGDRGPSHKTGGDDAQPPADGAGDVRHAEPSEHLPQVSRKGSQGYAQQEQGDEPGEKENRIGGVLQGTRNKTKNREMREQFSLPFLKNKDRAKRIIKRIDGYIGTDSKRGFLFEANLYGARILRRSNDLGELQELKTRISERVNDMLSEKNRRLLELSDEYDEMCKRMRDEANGILLDIQKSATSIFKEESEAFYRRQSADDEAGNKPVTYILKLDKANVYKIGMTKDIEQRLMTYGNKSHRLIAIRKDNIEGLLKIVYKFRRINGSEEFEFTPEEIDKIIESYNFERV